MIRKYTYGHPFDTEAVTEPVPVTEGLPEFGEISLEEGFRFTYRMAEKDVVCGLGESVRGINKRGFEYVSDCTDEPGHHEDTESLYGAHNFIIVDGSERFGIFVDYPSALTFDVGYRKRDWLVISCEKADLDLYIITGESDIDIVRQFRKIIGMSYIPPKFAFGFGQSRWGYKTKDDFREVACEHRDNHVPIDMIYMDIDYMQDFKDFTLSEENFKDFPDFVREMKEKKIHLIPIIDAGVKIEKGYDVYEEGVAKNYFCKRDDGSDFVAAVWPGYTHFPDVLNKEARDWFGDKYAFLLDQGIDGFWNDMNEPAIFYSPEGIEKAEAAMKKFIDSEDKPLFSLIDTIFGIKNSKDDYSSFYHNVDGKKVCHADVHNLYGFNMTRAAGEAFERLRPDERILIFSRSSYVGMHRYGGMWMGDNTSWWSHILMNIKMLPALNMVGLLYTGADLGGFGSNCSRDLVLRWLALGVFTPLMRNHSATGTRRQEFYQFEDTEDFRSIINVRYRLVPFLYSEYMKAVLNYDMMFKPLGFVYPDDHMAVQTEDQLMLGDQAMIAPVYTQNADGRYVYLPENMLFAKFMPDGSIYEENMEAGIHYINVELNEVPLFIREGKCIPVAEPAETVDEIDYSRLTKLGFPGASYSLYDDDGIHKDYEGNMRLF